MTLEENQPSPGSPASGATYQGSAVADDRDRLDAYAGAQKVAGRDSGR